MNINMDVGGHLGDSVAIIEGESPGEFPYYVGYMRLLHNFLQSFVDTP